MPFFKKTPHKLDISVNIFLKKYITGQYEKIQSDEQFKSAQYCVLLDYFLTNFLLYWTYFIPHA